MYRVALKRNVRLCQCQDNVLRKIHIVLINNSAYKFFFLSCLIILMSHAAQKAMQ